MERLARFYDVAAEYRKRFECDGIALTFNEAVAAYKLLPPLSGVGDSSCAAFPVGLSEVLEILKSPESYYKPVWKRHCMYEIYVSLLGARRAQGKYEDVEKLERLIAGLQDEGADKRPRGTHDPLRRIGRDLLIVKALGALSDCGLPDTSLEGSSLAGALAEASGLIVSAIATALKNIPPPWRKVKHSRERFAEGVGCALCGKVGRCRNTGRGQPAAGVWSAGASTSPLMCAALSAARSGGCRNPGRTQPACAWTASLRPHDRSEPIGARYSLPNYTLSALRRGWIPSVSRLWKTEEFNSGEPNTANGGSRGANLPEQEHDLRADRPRAFPEVCSLERAGARFSRTRDRRLDRGARDEPRGGALRATERVGSPSSIPRGGVSRVGKVAPGRWRSGPGA